MSCNPHALGGHKPTYCVFCPLNFAKSWRSSTPKQYGVLVPARQAYSHSASVGKRTCRSRSVNMSPAVPVPGTIRGFSFLQNALAASHVTLSTGALGRRSLNFDGLSPITCSYCA